MVFSTHEFMAYRMPWFTFLVELFRRHSGRCFLNRKGLLTSTSSSVQSQLGKLKSGDFLSLEGFYNDDNKTIFIGSINYVGLKDLLGNWIGDDQYCYRFQDYSVLSIYNKNEKNRCEFTATYMARGFSYFINPSNADWSVLLSDDDDSYLMDLTLNSKNSADLSLYDSQSGDILRQIKIRR